MNKNVSLYIRIVALMLMLAMSFSLVACDLISGLGKPEQPPVENTDGCLHEMTIDSQCIYCGKIFIKTIAELSLDAESEEKLPSGTVENELLYVKATVSQIIDKLAGEMIIEDETGSIRVKSLFTEDGVSYDKMSEKPDEFDEVFLHCVVEKVGDIWQIKTAFIVEFTAVEAPAKVITIAEAIEICNANTEPTAERYLILATVQKVSNPQYGEMTIADETGELYVYGAYNADGTIGYSSMTDRPVKGDEVLLSCSLNNHNGTPQAKTAWIIEYKHDETPFDESNYTAMSIADAREAAEGTLIKLSGVVAQITYANGYKPSGVILVDGTSSIYLYDGDLAGQVSIGNTVTVAGEKTYWILEGEISSANKFGYKGACQLDGITLLENDKGNTAFDKSWIEETTVKSIMDTPVTENITNKIFKVNALVKKAPGNGFINYYIDDLDGITGSYVYTQCNGGDFSWLDEFDGKICTVYFVAINAKSSSSGCVWRFLPIQVSYDNYSFDTTKAPEFAVKYHGLTQLLNSYTGDPAKELVTGVSSELLGFEGVTLSYTSNNESVVYFANEDGKIVFHCGREGSATVTVTATYSEYTYSECIEISVQANADYESISIADAIAKEVGETVTVKGIVGPSLVNQQGFYLFDESGMIAIKVNDTSIFSTIDIGNEVVITGTRDMWHNQGATFGQITISSAEVIANYYGEHDYLTIEPITDKNVEYFYNLDELDMSETTKLYHLTATITVEETNYYTNIYVTDGDITIRLYCSSASQYNWLKAYAGQTVTVEIAPCNWNSKSYYTGCVLAVINEDGTKVLNTLNFN